MRVVGGMTAVYLSLKQVGERLGVKNAAAYRLPEPDAMIGTTRGWLPRRSWPSCWAQRAPA